MGKRVAILGCGVIGTHLALAIDRGYIPATLHAVYDEDPLASERLADKLKSRPIISQNAHLLSYPPVDVVVEAASQTAVRNAGLSVLQNRRDLIIMSVGALLDDSIRETLEDACSHYGCRVYLPSGAIGGLDAIAAVKQEVEKISITTTKSPSSLGGAPYFEEFHTDPATIQERTVLFSGTATDAVKLFPANVNVAALVSLAAGRNATVTVVADPGTTKNIHVIDASGTFGSMSFVIHNVPDADNPRTSRLAILAAIETLYRYCSYTVRIGT